ncbi:MAG: hypothetical protein JEZ14_08535 [Marinilabiliaceae bacterium]|nr:hypothetical protein [Marinilabiliaceae bacterium]
MIMKKAIFILFVSVLMLGCESTKNITTMAPAPPEGIAFETISNYKDFASIAIPVSGGGFKATNDRPDVVLPRIEYQGVPCSVWSSVKGTEGALEQQFEALKRAQGLVIKEDSKVIFQKKSIGGHEVALIEISRVFGDSGYASLSYGYLVKNENKAALLFIKDGYLTPETDKEKYKSDIDEVFRYMIENTKFL